MILAFGWCEKSFDGYYQSWTNEDLSERVEQGFEMGSIKKIFT